MLSPVVNGAVSNFQANVQLSPGLNQKKLRAMTTENFEGHIFASKRVIMFSQPSASDMQEEQVDRSQNDSSSESPDKTTEDNQ